MQDRLLPQAGIDHGLAVIAVGNIEEQRRGDHVEQKGRTAIADKRQRHADDGQDSADHSQIDHPLTAKIHGNAHGQQFPEGIARIPGAVAAEINNHTEQNQHKHGPPQAPFLGQDGKGKVRMGFRQVAELADAFTQTLSHDAAGPDGDEPLYGLIAQSLFIGPGIVP